MFGPKPKGKENVQTYTWRIKPGAKVNFKYKIEILCCFSILYNIECYESVINENSIFNLITGWKSKWSDVITRCKCF